jgi:hypothetical protein
VDQTALAQVTLGSRLEHDANEHCFVCTQSYESGSNTNTCPSEHMSSGPIFWLENLFSSAAAGAGRSGEALGDSAMLVGGR